MLSLLVLAAGLSACSDDASTAAPTLADARALLAAHAKALHDRDRDAFLRAISTSGKAASFRQLQADEFDNLQQVPLASWSYEAVDLMTDTDLIKAADKRYGATSLIVHVTLSYAIERADPVPTERDLYWTFVREHGRVVVIGDGDGAALSAISWHGPWDFGTLQVAAGVNSLVLGHPADAQELPVLAHRIDAAIPAVTAVWGRDWPQYVVAVLPGSQDEFKANSGNSVGIDSVAALAVTDGDDAVHDTKTGRRLIISPGELGRLSAAGQEIVLRHEITHLAAVNATTESSPAWVVEGFADYVANLENGQTVAVTAQELKAVVDAGHPPAALPTQAEFSGAQLVAARAYEGAWLACRLIASKVGRAGLVHFYTVVGEQLTVGDAAATAGLQAVLHESLASFTAQWRAYLRQQLG